MEVHACIYRGNGRESDANRERDGRRETEMKERGRERERERRTTFRYYGGQLFYSHRPLSTYTAGQCGSHSNERETNIFFFAWPNTVY